MENKANTRWKNVPTIKNSQASVYFEISLSMKDYIQLLKRQELLQNAELSIWNKQSSGHFMLITKLSCSDKALKPRVCSSSAFPGAGEGREAGKALGPSVGRAGASGG